jgi:hypothetical protein
VAFQSTLQTQDPEREKGLSGCDGMSMIKIVMMLEMVVADGVAMTMSCCHLARSPAMLIAAAAEADATFESSDALASSHLADTLHLTRQTPKLTPR